jgi:glutaredoxin 3
VYEEHDINENLAARNEFTRRNLQGVPAFLIGDQTVVGLDARRIQELLDYRVISCEKCGGRMRVPKDKGRIRINCPKCRHEFVMQT